MPAKKSRHKHRKGYRITNSDLYLHYPYKDQENTSYVRLPYVKKSEITNHEYTLTHTEWSKIVDGVFNYVLEEALFKGEAVLLPHRIGTIQIQKLKFRRINWAKVAAEGGHHYHDNVFTDDWCPVIDWHKYMNGIRFKHKNVWKLRLARTVKTRLAKLITSDITLMQKFNEVR